MCTRSFSVHNDKLHYMIKIKSGRLNRNQPLSYVRGYPTAESAKDDISRLEIHLQTKRVSSFEKYIPDEMAELLQLSSKRKRNPLPKQTKCEPALKVLSGLPFIRLRRKLNWKYFVYRKNLLQLHESVPILSKEAWLRVQEDETQQLKDFAVLEQGIKHEKALAYINQRLRVLNIRKRTNQSLVVDLRRCFCNGEAFTKIREVVIEEPSDVIDLTADLPKFTKQSTTQAQMNRVTIQCYVVLNMLQQLDLRNDSELAILQRFLSEIETTSSSTSDRDLMFKQHDVLKKRFRSENSMVIISEKVRALTGDAVSNKKIREWYHDYLESGSFEEDLRGSWKRDMFLDEYGYSLRFQMYLKNERKLTVDIATKELESIIHKDPPKSESGRRAFDGLRPFSRRTVHRWMLKLGCKYEKATVSYYTDTHEAEETKKDMKQRYENKSIN